MGGEVAGYFTSWFEGSGATNESGLNIKFYCTMLSLHCGLLKTVINKKESTFHALDNVTRKL
jgi:hypothetical protein